MARLSDWAKTIVLQGETFDIELVQNELFLDMENGPGTQALAGTAYGAAVRDCKVIGKDYFLLQVRPEMRGILWRQLKEFYKCFRVFRFSGEPESRLLLTDEISIRFEPTSTLIERIAYLEKFFPGEREAEDVTDGIYRLTGTFLDDPILVANALQESPLILSAVPIIVAYPPPTPQADKVEMSAAVPLRSGASRSYTTQTAGR